MISQFSQHRAMHIVRNQHLKYISLPSSIYIQVALLGIKPAAQMCNAAVEHAFQ